MRMTESSRLGGLVATTIPDASVDSRWLDISAEMQVVCQIGIGVEPDSSSARMRAFLAVATGVLGGRLLRLRLAARGLLRWCLVEDRLQLLVRLWSGRPACPMEGDRSLPMLLQPHDAIACVVLGDLGVQSDGLRHLRLLSSLMQRYRFVGQRDLLRTTGLGDREPGCPCVEPGVAASRG